MLPITTVVTHTCSQYLNTLQILDLDLERSRQTPDMEYHVDEGITSSHVKSSLLKNKGPEGL